MNQAAGPIDAKLISLVVPCYNESEAFPRLREALVDQAAKLGPRYQVEFVLVDDGSRDDTWQQIVDFSARDPRVRGIALSRNFGHQNALTSGYDLARGDAVICLDADLQDPLDVMQQMIEEWEKGADIVYGVRSGREGETLFKRGTAYLFYQIIRVIGQTNVPPHSGDFRLLSRRSLLALQQMREKHRYLRGMVGWLGFRTVQVTYQRKPRTAGVTKYNFLRMLRLALDAIVSSSTFPLRLTYMLALLASLPFLGYLVYAAVKEWWWGIPPVPGWSSTVVAIIAFGSLNLVCLGIVGEYLGRIYEQVKDRPLYLVRELIESKENARFEPGERAGEPSHGPERR